MDHLACLSRSASETRYGTQLAAGLDRWFGTAAARCSWARRLSDVGRWPGGNGPRGHLRLLPEARLRRVGEQRLSVLLQQESPADQVVHTLVTFEPFAPCAA